MRAFTNTDELATEARRHLDTVMRLAGGSEEAGEAIAWLETFAAVSLRVISKTNPSKVRDAARVEWIKALMPSDAPTKKPTATTTERTMQ